MSPTTLPAGLEHGHVTFLGAGPGDPGLLTLRAVEALANADVLVAEHDGVVAGYVRLGEGFGIPAHRHVVVIDGLAVDPDRQRLGIARQLVEAAVAEARRRGARKVTLRVLGPNTGARRVYERCGFVVEGVLRGEFHVDGVDVDDVLMARPLA